jgi:predicted site-specific integrase-resolvase
MSLVTPKDAAKAVYVTTGMISYWVRKGYVIRHIPEGNTRNYLVDLDEVKAAQAYSRTRFKSRKDEGLLTREEAARVLWVGVSEISHYIRQGYLTRHYLLGNKYNYLLSLEEVKAVPDKIYERMENRKPELRERALNAPKSPNGKFLKRAKK